MIVIGFLFHSKSGYEDTIIIFLIEMDDEINVFSDSIKKSEVYSFGFFYNF